MQYISNSGCEWFHRQILFDHYDKIYRPSKYPHIPIFNIVVIALLATVVFFVRKKVKALVSWLCDRDKPADAT